MSILYSPQTKTERRVFLVLLGLSGVALLFIAILYALQPRAVIGDALVNTSSGNAFEIPPPSISYFHVKPVTIFYAALVVFGYCGLSLYKTSIARLPGYLRTFLLVLAVLSVTVCAYEILFNFMLWTIVVLTQNVIPDHAINNYPAGIFQINLVFATKTFVAMLFVSYFAVDSLRVKESV